MGYGLQTRLDRATGEWQVRLYHARGFDIIHQCDSRDEAKATARIEAEAARRFEG